MKRARRICAHPGCRELTEGKWCPEHQPAPRQRRPDKRPGSRERGYDGKHEAARESYLALHPLCERCGKAATVLHHRKPISEGGARLNSRNFEALCRDCHEAEHGRRQAEKSQIPYTGGQAR